MRSKMLVIISGVAVLGLIAGMTSAPQINVAASDGSVFAGPAYPSAECTSFVGGGTYGVVPQQWNSTVGLPVSIPRTPAKQRIVIPEFDEIPSMPAINALLRQCGLLAPGAPDVEPTYQTLPSPWGSASTRLGSEATMDAAIVYAALPPNTDVFIANTSQTARWYGFFVNAARACGIDFATPPSPGDTAATVPAMVKGPNFPAGGCIITASWGANEQQAFTSPLLANTQAASVVLQRLASLGVLTFISAGDEGAGGCLSGGNPIAITNVVLTTPNSTTTIGTEPNTRTFFTGTATFTTATPHGFSAPVGATPGSEVVLNRLTSPPGLGLLSGIFEVTAVPSTTTFTIKQGLASRFEISPAAPASGVVAPFSGTDFGYTEDPVYSADNTITFSVQNGAKTPSFPATHPDVVAVGGTQWLPQADTLANGLSIQYEPGRPYQEFVWKDSFANSNCANAPDAFVLGQEGTGGGESGFFDMPSYQRAAARASYGDLGPNPKRMMPDIAALAGWPMYAIAATDPTGTGNPTAADFCTGGNFPCAAAAFPWAPSSGTSAATPLVAIGFANVNAALTARGIAPITKGGSQDVHSIIYSAENSTAIPDVPEFRGAVRSGDNNLFGAFDGVSMGYSALNGYDMTTGMGVPNFTRLANLLIARNTPPTPVPTQTPTPGPTPTLTPAPTVTPTATPAPVAPAPNPIDAIIADPSAVTAAALASLTPSEVAQIPPAIFGQLPAAAFRGLSAPQARALTTGQVAAIRPARARAIRPAVVRSLRPAQVAVLRPASVRALRPKQVSVLRPAQMRALSTRQVQAMRPKQVRALRPVQVRALTPKQQVIVNRKR